MMRALKMAVKAVVVLVAVPLGIVAMALLLIVDFLMTWAEVER